MLEAAIEKPLQVTDAARGVAPHWRAAPSFDIDFADAPEGALAERRANVVDDEARVVYTIPEFVRHQSTG